MKTKICQNCKRKLPATNEYFYKDKRKKDGLNQWCKKCGGERAKEYRQKNIERVRAQGRMSHFRNKEKNNKQSLDYYYKHREERLEKSKKWKREHKDYISNYNRQYKNEHAKDIKEWKKQYLKEHPEDKKQKNFRERRRRIRKEEVGGSHTLQEWNDIKKDYYYICPFCLKREPEIKLTEDHVAPISEWKNFIKKYPETSYQCDDIDNIQPLCQSCNSIKHTKNMRIIHPKFLGSIIGYRYPDIWK